jgi:hypothetical protein
MTDNVKKKDSSSKFIHNSAHTHTLRSIVRLYLDKSQALANPLSRNSGKIDSLRNDKRQKYSNNTNFNKSVNSFLFSMFNKSNDKSTDITGRGNKSNSNLPLIGNSKGRSNKSMRLRNDTKMPIKLVTGSIDMLGVDPSILLSPKSKSIHFNSEVFNTLPSRRSEGLDYDSMTEIKEFDNNVLNTIEYLETRPTLDSTRSRRVVEPTITEINRSKVSEYIASDGGENSQESSVEKRESSIKLLRSLKKVTINLEESKDDFKIRLKRIDTIKEENEDISKINLKTIYKRQYSNPSYGVDMTSIESSKGNVGIRFKRLSSKDTRFSNLNKLLSLKHKGNDLSGAVRKTLTEGVKDRESNLTKSFIRQTKKVMFTDVFHDSRKSAIAHSNKLLFRPPKNSNSFRRNTVTKGYSVGNITLSSDFSSSDTDSRWDNSRTTQRNTSVKGKQPKTDWERRMLKLRERLKFGYDKVLLEADGRVVELKQDFKPEKEIYSQMAESYREKFKVKRGKNLIESYKNSLKNFVKDYLLNEGSELFNFSNDVLFARQVILQDYYNEFLKRKYLDVSKTTDLLRYMELESFPDITIFKNFARDQEELPICPNFFARVHTLSAGLFNYNKKNNMFANKFLLADNVVYHDDVEHNEDSNNVSQIIRPKRIFGGSSISSSNSSTRYKKTVNIISTTDEFKKISRTKFKGRQGRRRSILLKEPEFSILTSNPSYLKQRDLHKKRTIRKKKRERAIFKTQPSILLNNIIVRDNILTIVG